MLKAKQPIDVEPRKPTVLVFGKWGLRKTWVALDFPRPYYIDSEGGADGEAYQQKLAASGGVYLGPSDGADNFNVVNEQLLALATEEHEYRTVVIDSFSKLFDMAVTEEEARLKDQGRDPNAFGAQRKPAIHQTRRLIHRLNQLDMTSLLICHEKPEWKAGEAVGVQFDGYEKLGYELSLVLNIYKHNLEHIAGVDKSRLAGFSVGDQFLWSYDEFAERYGRELLESKSKPITLATDKQLERIAHLEELVKFDTSVKARWFEKAGVSDFKQMKSSDMAKCIKFMENLIPEGTTLS